MTDSDSHNNNSHNDNNTLEQQIPLIHLPTIYAAKKIMKQLKQALAEFNAWWPEQVTNAVVFPLPVSENTQPNYVPWLPALTDITFDTQIGEEAITTTRYALSNFSRHPDDPALNIRRYPGVITLPSAQADGLMAHIAHINHLKNELIQVLSVIPDGSRASVLPKAFPGEHILLAYRNIHGYVNNDVRRLAFGWQGKFPKNIAITREAIKEKLMQERQHHEDTGNVGALLFCDQDLEKLEQLAGEAQLVERKLFAPSPRLRVLGAQKDKPALVIQAALPLFMAQDKQPLMKPLEAYHLEAQQQKNLKKNEYVPFIERHRIFIKKTYDAQMPHELAEDEISH